MTNFRDGRPRRGVLRPRGSALPRGTPMRTTQRSTISTPWLRAHAFVLLALATSCETSDVEGSDSAADDDGDDDGSGSATTPDDDGSATTPDDDSADDDSADD